MTPRTGKVMMKLKRRLAAAVVLVFLVVYAIAEFSILFGGPTNREFVQGYEAFARTPLFSGFFTMGSFLVALKTTILARIKETYETQEYRDTFRANRQKDPSARYYGGLDSVGHVLGLNIVMCLVSAVTQFTIGFLQSPWAASVAIAVAISSIALLVVMTFVLMAEHQDWFSKIESDAKKQMDLLDEENAKPAADTKEVKALVDSMIAFVKSELAATAKGLGRDETK